MASKSTALIDGDIYAYRYAFKNTQTFDWGDTQSELADLDQAKADIDKSFEQLSRELNTVNLIVCLSSMTNFRKQINPNYKANRKSVPKPTLLTDIRKFFIMEYPVKLWDGLEADDVMGILATDKKSSSGKRIIVSTDKDMLTIPGRVYNPRTKKLRRITKDEADYNFYRQVLMGDPVDNYSGVPRVGPVRADKILQEVALEEYWEACLSAFLGVGLTEEDALLNARMARILRVEDFNFETRRPILWTPT